MVSSAGVEFLTNSYSIFNLFRKKYSSSYSDIKLRLKQIFKNSIIEFENKFNGISIALPTEAKGDCTVSRLISDSLLLK